MKKTLLTVLSGLVLLLGAGSSFAFAAANVDDFPTKAITIINPYSAGGGSDFRCRVIAEILQRNWGQTVNVVSMPGGAGATGMLQAKRARPDGYTIILSSLGIASITPNRANVGFTTSKDFRGVAKITSSAYVIAVHKDSGITSFEALLAAARAKPGMTFGTPGAGLGQHLMFSDLLDRIPDVNMQHIPFSGTSDTSSALLGKHIDAAVMMDADILPHVLSGEIQVLASTGNQRSQLYPEVPTFNELGYKTIISGAWNGFLARKDTPDALVQKLQNAIADALKDPEVMDRFQKAQIIIDYADGATLDTMIAEENEQFSKIIKTLPN